jgi:hypothetical protein
LFLASNDIFWFFSIVFLFFEFDPHSLDFYFYFEFFCEVVDLKNFNLAL